MAGKTTDHIESNEKRRWIGRRKSGNRSMEVETTAATVGEGVVITAGRDEEVTMVGVCTEDGHIMIDDSDTRRLG